MRTHLHANAHTHTYVHACVVPESSLTQSHFMLTHLHANAHTHTHVHSCVVPESSLTQSHGMHTHRSRRDEKQLQCLETVTCNRIIVRYKHVNVCVHTCVCIGVCIYVCKEGVRKRGMHRGCNSTVVRYVCVHIHT